MDDEEGREKVKSHRKIGNGAALYDRLIGFKITNWTG
jgi:hypothetical protein